MNDLLKRNESGRRLNVFLLPSFNKNNKYIELFKTHLKHADPHITFIQIRKDQPIFIFGAVFSGVCRKSQNVIHIHWSTVLYGSQFMLKSIFLLAVNFLSLVVLKHFFGFKIVWTVHNFHAHDYPHPKIDSIGRYLTKLISDSIIVQQETTLTEYHYKNPSKAAYFVPHGNYVGVYGRAIPYEETFRRALGFKDEDILLLSFGAIAPYKLNEKIIDIVSATERKSPAVRLLIVGKGESEYVKKLRKMSSSHDNVVIMNEFVKDDDIPKYFAISDYSVFYYDGSEMTSGSMILSLSYGVPVIMRKIPAAEAISDESGFVFENDLELSDILTSIAGTKDDANRRHSIIKQMANCDWSRVSSETASIYKKLWVKQKHHGLFS